MDIIVLLSIKLLWVSDNSESDSFPLYTYRLSNLDIKLDW